MRRTTETLFALAVSYLLLVTVPAVIIAGAVGADVALHGGIGAIVVWLPGVFGLVAALGSILSMRAVRGRWRAHTRARLKPFARCHALPESGLVEDAGTEACPSREIGGTSTPTSR